MATENPRVWFKSISLENVRSFGTKQTINFTDKEGNAARWNVILGDNGTGKTTVLKGLVAVYYLSELERRYADDLSRNPDVDSNIVFNLNAGENDLGPYDFLLPSMNKRYAGQVFYLATIGSPVRSYRSDEAIPVPALFAYGAGRKIGNSAISQEVYSRVISLFDDNESLINAEELLVQADYYSLKNKTFYANKYRTILELLLKLFEGEINNISAGIDPTIQFPKVYFDTVYGKVRLHSLSLGYKTLIAWMVDFAKGLLDRYPNSENPLAEPAVCLVDEIDLHLHPKFQRTIIQFLTETFPNTQFIVTAHSPLIVQSAEDANIILLKREGNETHVADGIDVHNWRVDQILSSDLFGGISVRPPEAEDKMQRRRALLLKDSRTKKEQQELTQLEENLGQLTASESEEALKALELIGKVLSK